jgi:uncharacterized protein (TIGR03083 family)
MDFSRLHDCFRDDYRLLRSAVESTDPAARVPSCPEWTVADLAHHVSEVYLHKAECIRLGREPQPWPPERAVTVDSAYESLERQFDAHTPESFAATWYEPDRTVGFWLRRMAQETVIHRVDAELAAAGPLSPIPDDLAIDGVDEILTLFLAYGSVRWRDYLGDLFGGADERPILVRTTTGQAWTVTADQKAITATATNPTTSDAALTVAAEPVPLLLWLWNRAPDDTVTITGDATMLTQFATFRAALT